MRTAAAALTLALLALPHPLPAQRIAAFEPAAAPRLVPVARQEPPDAAVPSRGRMTAGSMLGASVGSLTGWTAGVLLVVAAHGSANDWSDAFAAAAAAALVASAGSVVLGGVGSRIGVRAAGGEGGPLGKHILASLAGWGASMLVMSAVYSNTDSQGNSGVAFGLLVGSHGVVTGLLAPRR